MSPRHDVVMPRALSKVPAVTAVFWVTKVLTTGMGETTSDFLVHRLGPALAIGLGALAFVVALTVQLKAVDYQAWVYWAAVVMVSVFGTMAADVLHVGLGIPYAVSSVFFAAALGVVFASWYVCEHTLSIHSIRTTRRELFYWATVSTTFALGTATGDMTAKSLHLGYVASGLLFAVAITVPAVAYWRFGLNAIVAFWAAYIVTRPLGASFADWAGVPAWRGGLGWGTGWVSLVMSAVITVLVAYLGRSQMGSADSTTARPASQALTH